MARIEEFWRNTPAATTHALCVAATAHQSIRGEPVEKLTLPPNQPSTLSWQSGMRPFTAYEQSSRSLLMLSKVSSFGPSRTTRQPANDASKYFSRSAANPAGRLWRPLM